MSDPIHDGREGFRKGCKIDHVDIRILEGLSILGSRNLALIAEHLDMPGTTVRYRFNRMLADKTIFLHVNPYHANIGLKTAVVFAEAKQGYEELLLDCLKVNDFWVSLCRIYCPYEGGAGIWTVPVEHVEDFKRFLNELVDLNIAKSIEINWTTDHEGIPIRSRWFSADENSWVFNWSEWINEVETIEGNLPWALREPDDWPMNFDYIDLRIISELEKDGTLNKADISSRTGISVEVVKYHLREHILKRDLIEGYQIEIFRFPPLSSESLFFKFEFDFHDDMTRFALSLTDKPFPTFIGKVLDKNTLVSHIYLPKEEAGEFIKALSTLIRKGLLKQYDYWMQDVFVQWRETIPFRYYSDNSWNFDADGQIEKLMDILDERSFVRPTPKYFKKTVPIL